MNRNKYQRLSQEDKDLIRKMTLDGKSLRQISALMKFGITTIYYHVRKFKPKQRREFICNLNDFQIGELVGAFAGDGNFYHSLDGRCSKYIVRYYLSYKDDRDYVNYLNKLLQEMNLNTNIFFIKYKGNLSVTELRVCSKDFYNFLRKYLVWDGKKRYSVGLKEDISNYNDDFLRGFIRGLMDTDGFVEVCNVAFGVVSKKLALNFRDILNKFGIVDCNFKIKSRGGNRVDLYLCRTHRRDLEKYYELFGFSNPRKLNSLLKIINEAARI